MRIIIKLFIVAILAILAAIYSNNGPGHVIILAGDYRVDMSLLSLCIGILLLFILVYYLIRFWVNMRRLPHNVSKWKNSRR